MGKYVDVIPTAAVMSDMVHTMRKFADEIENLTIKMMDTKDITLASEAVSAVTNCISNLRIDLLVTRPIREFERELFVINSNEKD